MVLESSLNLEEILIFFSMIDDYGSVGPSKLKFVYHVVVKSSF